MSISNSELRVQSAEQRALQAEEGLQAALDKIQDLERQLKGYSSLEPKGCEGKGKINSKPWTEAHRMYHPNQLYLYLVLQKKRKHHHTSHHHQ